jgi:hypothetical protein
MSQFRRCIATKAAAALALWCVAGSGWAAPAAGSVVQLSGPLLVKKADGAVRILALNALVESGDTLMTEKGTYALVKFIDSSAITIKPSTTFKVVEFSFDAEAPLGDRASFELIKGGVRSVSGVLGKRSRDRFEMKTASASIGVRGTTFIADLVPPSAPSAPTAPSGPGMPPGLYVHVLDGAIQVSNPGGTSGLAAGQFGFVPNSTVPPVIVPQNPGLSFSPPPSFNAAGGAPGTSSGALPNSNAADCVVR